MPETLVTTRYVPPGVYIGQLIRPKPGNLTADARVCNYIGRGSTLAVGQNLGIRRSFVFGESINLPTSAPFTYALIHKSDGIKNAPSRIFDAISGLELRVDQWEFTKTGSDFTGIIIQPSAVNPNADYRIDYQSTDRNVLDPVPVQNLRAIKSVGNSQNRSQYVDFKDFFIPYAFTGPTASGANLIIDPLLTSVFPDAGNIGAGAVAIDPAASYDHNYNRFYQLTVMGISGGPGSFVATFQWSARRYSGGLEALPPVPLHSTGQQPTFTADQTNAPSLVQDLELGIKVDINFDSFANFNVGDKFYFNGVGPGLVEFDGRLQNINQFLEFSAISSALAGGSTGSLTYASDNNFTGIYNTKFALEVTAASGSSPNRQVTLIWSSYGELIGPTGSVTILEAAPTALLTQGVKIQVNFGITNFAVGDTFGFEVLAPRVFYQAKDDRVLKLTIGSATLPGADNGIITGSFETGTAEGGFGQFTAETNLLFGTNQKTGNFQLPDNVSMFARNMMRGNINGTSYGVGDVFNAAVTSEDVIDWSLSAQVEETREVTAILTDVTGAVTGTSGMTYTILTNVYDSGTVSVVRVDNNAPVSFLEIPGTRFLAFVTQPTTTIKITYRFRGAEPSPGQLYFMTANFLRPQDLYNNPTLILDRQEGRAFLAPAQSDNHLYIMNELVFGNGAPGAYYTQPFDSDGDGILTTTDVQESLAAHEGVSRITDLCLLSLFDSLSDSLEINEKACDPFEKREQMLWVGAPMGTPIGDIDTEGSLISLALRTLQVTPQSPANGTRVLVAPTECSIQILLENNVTQTVSLDGSFVAGATSALVNSFADPASTILRKNLSGFLSVQTYSDPENILLGGASITYLSDQGNSVFRFEEDVTVDTLAEEFQLISGTTQKQFVTKVVRREMDKALISVVTPNAQAAVALIRSTLSGILLGLLGRGLIADYQDEAGNVREFDADKDIVIIRDTSTLTAFNFYYAYFIKAPIKRLFGLFAVNTNDFGLGGGV